jgi:hypothetical protein
MIFKQLSAILTSQFYILFLQPKFLDKKAKRPNMKTFESHKQELLPEELQGTILELEQISNKDNKRKFYIESYGCQMNFSDSEIVASILAHEGIQSTRNIDEADMIFINTCSIREKAEESVSSRNNLLI